MLRDCGIDDSGAAFLAESLDNLIDLIILDLAQNEVSIIGLREVCRRLNPCKQLRCLQIFDNLCPFLLPEVALLLQVLPNLELVSITRDENQMSDLYSFGLLVQTGLTPNRQTKVYLCGESNSGKTNLTESLISNLEENIGDTRSSLHRAISVDVHKHAHGLNISSVEINGAEFSFWDFAGHKDQHSHRKSSFIFPELSVFLLLINASEPAERNRQCAKSWLEYILSESPHGLTPTVVLIATHADIFKTVEERKELYNRFADLKNALWLENSIAKKIDLAFSEFIFIDTHDIESAEMHQISNFLQSYNQSQLERQIMIPQICMDIIDIVTAQLRFGDCPIVSWPKYKGYLENISKMNDNLLKNATRYLHSIGELYFAEHGVLAGHVILDLSWLNQCILGYLFTRPDRLDGNADADRIVRFQKLAAIGPVPRSDIPIDRELLDTGIHTMYVLQYFSLAFGLPHYDAGEVSNHYVFPSLLQSCPPDVWSMNADSVVHVGRRYYHRDAPNKIPASFFPLLQLKVFYELSRLQGTVCLYRNEMYTRHNDVECHVWLTDDHQTVVMHARGPAGSSRACRVLQARIRLLASELFLQSTTNFFAVFRPEYTSVVDLKLYLREPKSYSPELVNKLRIRNCEVVSTDLVAEVLGMDFIS